MIVLQVIGIAAGCFIGLLFLILFMGAVMRTAEWIALRLGWF